MLLDNDACAECKRGVELGIPTREFDSSGGTLRTWKTNREYRSEIKIRKKKPSVIWVSVSVAFATGVTLKFLSRSYPYSPLSAALPNIMGRIRVSIFDR